MKKFLLLIPVGLLAAIGVTSFVLDHSYSLAQSISNAKHTPQGEQELFCECEHSLYQIVRFGDNNAIVSLNKSLESISVKLNEQQEKGFSVGNIKKMLSLYKTDTELLTQKFTPQLEQLHQLKQFEQSHEKNFLISVEQIGLYELKSANANLNKIRKDFIKEPSPETKALYVAQQERIRNIISELYLDTAIEQPLFAYLENHKHYLETIYTAYNEIGYERINRLRANGYAIKTELQLLPST